MRLLIIIIKMTISILLLWFLAHTSKLNFKLLLNLLDAPAILVTIISIYFIIVAISSWRWQQINSALDIKLGYTQTILPTYLGIAFNNLIPGGIGGDFFRFHFVKKKISVKRSTIMMSILFDRIIGLMGIFVITTIIAVFYINELLKHTITIYFISLCALVCATFMCVYIFLMFLPKRIGISLWLQKSFQNKKWLSPLLSLLDAARTYRNSKLVILNCLAASVIIQILIAITCLLIAKIMHFPIISLPHYLVALAITQIVNLIPIAPGGFGVGEMAFANILILLNPSMSATYATIFLAYRIIGIITYLPGISVFIFEGHKLKASHAE